MWEHSKREFEHFNHLHVPRESIFKTPHTYTLGPTAFVKNVHDHFSHPTTVPYKVTLRHLSDRGGLHRSPWIWAMLWVETKWDCVHAEVASLKVILCDPGLLLGLRHQAGGKPKKRRGEALYSVPSESPGEALADTAFTADLPVSKFPEEAPPSQTQTSHPHWILSEFLTHRIFSTCSDGHYKFN